MPELGVPERRPRGIITQASGELSVFPRVRSVPAGAVQVPEEADLRPVVDQLESDVLDVHRSWEAGVAVARRPFSIPRRVSPRNQSRRPLALLLVRAVPAALYASTVGRRQAVAAGLLQATSLPFLVTATAIGVTLGEMTPVTAAALVSAGLLSVIVFPLVAVALLAGPAHTAVEGSGGPAQSPERR